MGYTSRRISAIRMANIMKEVNGLALFMFLLLEKI